MSENRNNARGKNFDVFISYRRSDGTVKAKALDLAFGIDDCRTFLDFKSLGTGAFDKRLENAVLDAPIFIMVLTPDYFVRCNQDGDWVRKEIELALENGKKIIPINYDKVLDKVPDYLDEEFRSKLGVHNFVNLHGDNTFDATVKDIFEKEIRPFIGITPRPENKVKVRVKADADCELISDNEVIATIQQGKTAQLFFEKGEYEITARSIEFSDIDNVIERTFDNVSFNYLVKTELAYRVKQRQIEIDEEEKKKKEEEERIRREEEARIAAEKAEAERLEEEKRLAEQRKKEEELRRIVEQSRLEAEKQRRRAEDLVVALMKERKKNQNQTEINLEPEIWLEKYAWWYLIPIFMFTEYFYTLNPILGGYYPRLLSIILSFIFGLLFEVIIIKQKKKKGCIQIRAKKRWRYIFPIISLCFLIVYFTYWRLYWYYFYI